MSDTTRSQSTDRLILAWLDAQARHGLAGELSLLTERVYVTDDRHTYPGTGQVVGWLTRRNERQPG